MVTVSVRLYAAAFSSGRSQEGLDGTSGFNYDAQPTNPDISTSRPASSRKEAALPSTDSLNSSEKDASSTFHNLHLSFGAADFLC
jgi:hypothetical protein